MPSALIKTALAAACSTALLALAACSQSATPSASPSDATPSASTSASPSPSPSSTIKPSNNLDAITVKNAKFGEKPTIAVKPTPWAIDKTRVEVLTKGDGAVVNPSYVFANYQGVNGRTGKVFDGNFGKGQPVMFNLEQVVPGFKKALEGKRVGDRILVAMPGSDGYDSQGGSSQAGIQVGDTLIFVIDIVDTVLSGPTGKAIKPPAGLPVVTEKDGKPTVTIPKTDPPTTMVVQPLTTGTGRTVTAKDVIAVKYIGYSWKTGNVIEDKTSDVDGGLLSSTIPGWQKGLLGKKVGQRVLLVLPPADGYPQGSNNPPVEAGDTVVYVIDILYAGTQAA